MVDMWCQHRRASTRRLAAVSAGLHKPVRSPAAAASSSYAAVLHEHRRLQQRTPAASRGRAGEEGRIAAGLRMRVDGTSFTCAPRTAAELAQGIALSSAHETPSAGTEAAVCFAVVGGAWATPPPAHTHHASHAFTTSLFGQLLTIYAVLHMTGDQQLCFLPMMQISALARSRPTRG